MSKKAKVEQKEDDHARRNAAGQLESIIEMVDKLEASEVDDKAREDVVTEIQESPLSVQVRSDWYTLGGDVPAPFEFEILLSTGGPACRIVGELSEHGEPRRAWIEYQDWGTPWTEYFPSGNTGWIEKLLTYCRQFYFGG